MRDRPLYPPLTPEIAVRRRDLAPAIANSFQQFADMSLASGALSAKTKHLIAFAVAQVTQSPYCIRSHAKWALHVGATPKELMEAAWVAAMMRSAATVTHMTVAVDEFMRLEEASQSR